MVKNLLNYNNLVEYLRKRDYKEIREGEFIVNEDEEFEIADVLVVRKGQNYKEDLSKLKKEIEESASLVEGERKEYGILFVDNHVIFLRRVTDGLRSKVITLRKSLDKISPAFEKKFKKLLKDIGNWQYWDELFDRSDIIEEFYKLYIKARENLLKNIRGIADDKRKEEFADDLLMQLLIIWYLQEKGFLNNDPRYLVTKFKEYRNLGFDSYYRFLRELFKTMMSEPNDGIYHKDDKFGRIVVTGPAPFLNGDFEDVEIPDEVFYVEGKTDLLKKVDPKKVKPSDVSILNLFESRDWTEGNIDEFVLGAIFEKLMTAEDRKEKGAYYTPEPITEYICNNTIKPYLVDRINEKFGTKYESLDEFFEKDINEERYALLFNEMQNIKILDPACGSGHFLETAINVLVEIYEKIWKRARELGFSYENFAILTANEKGEIIKEPLITIDDENERILKLKFHIIISRNLYGVDILPSAIKVAKARLFLSLAKHFDARKETHVRFPNVHFNLRVGNSLIGFTDLNAFEGVEGQVTLEQFFAIEDGEPLNIELDKELENYIKKMDKVIGTNAYALLTEVRDHFGQKLTLDRLKKVLRLRSDLIKILLVSLNTDYVIRLKELIDEITNRFNEKLNDEYVKYLIRRSIRINKDKLEEIGYFHWIMEFSEVFLERGGFDVVIGNPPHGAKISNLEKEIWRTNYILVERGLDSAKTFVERSILLLKDNAPLSFVIPKPSTYSYSWEDFRNYILNLEISHCIDLGKAFENVKHEQIVLIVWKRNRTSRSYLGGYYNKSNGAITEMSTIPTKLVKSVGVLLSKLNKKEVAIVEYLIEQKFSDMSSFDIFRGLPRSLSSENGERCIKGKDIGRYFIRFPQEFVYVSAVNDNRIVRLKRKKIIAQRIVAHVAKPFDRIIIMAFPDMMGYLTFETVTNIVPEEENVIKPVTLILNSRFVCWFVYSMIYNKAIRDMDFDAYFVKRILLPDYESQVNYLLNTVCDYLLFLNADEDTKQSFAEIIDFIDGKLADSLVYELYFKEKFIEDSKKAIKEGKEPIYSQLEKGSFLVDLVAKYLKPINYDSYARLAYSIEPLSEEEKQKMEKMKKECLKTIKEVAEAIKADDEIMKLIEKIKQHEWIKVIEGNK